MLSRTQWLRICVTSHLFNLPFLKVSNFCEPFAFCCVLLHFHQAGFCRPVRVSHGFVSNSGIQVSSPVGVQILPRLLVHVLARCENTQLSASLSLVKICTCFNYIYSATQQLVAQAQPRLCLRQVLSCFKHSLMSWQHVFQRSHHITSMTWLGCF